MGRRLNPPPNSPPPRHGAAPAANAPPQSPPNRPQAQHRRPNNKINIIQININGIKNKHQETKHLLKHHQIHVATIQETKLKDSDPTPTFPEYTTLRHDRRGGLGGGLITLIHKTLPFTNTTPQTLANLPQDDTLELQSITIRLNKQDIKIINMYIPPKPQLHRDTPSNWTTSTKVNLPSFWAI